MKDVGSGRKMLCKGSNRIEFLTCKRVNHEIRERSAAKRHVNEK